MGISTTRYGYGTSLTMAYPWGTYRGARVLCADGQIRRTTWISITADTFFSVPAAVKVDGCTVSGYVTTESLGGLTTATDDQDPTVVKFSRYDYGRNASALPSGLWRGTRFGLELEPISRRRDGIDYLTHDAVTGAYTGDLAVPCSRYGRSGAECAPVAWRLAYIMSRETDETLTRYGLDHAMGLVVNDHDDVTYIIRNYGGYKYA